MRVLRLPARLGILMVVLARPAGIAPAAQHPGAAYWPQFHGPNRDNISGERGLLKEWPKGGPHLLWVASGLGHGFATVSIADGRIYTAGNIAADTVITAMDAGGKILWQVPNGRAWQDPVPGARGTPTLDGERLWHESPFGDVVCLEAKTGKKVWQW